MPKARVSSWDRGNAGTTTDRRDIARLADYRRLACRRETKKGKADVVLRNGKIYTADPARSIRQAIAFTGNTIAAVGNDADVTPLIGASTKVVNLDGELVPPGLIDTPIRHGQPLEMQACRCESHHRCAEARSPDMPGQGAR
jgi:hypothetical protein